MNALKQAERAERGPQALWARIVIVAFDSGPDLQICIDHLSEQTFQSFEVVIVDNASKDDVVRTVSLPNARYRRLFLTENHGFSGGTNIGAKGCQTDWIITLNPDAWPRPTWLEELYIASQLFPTFKMLSSTIVQADDPSRLDSFGDSFSIFGVARNAGVGRNAEERPDFYCEVFSPSGAAAAYRSDVFFSHEGFDADFFCYLEDIDIAYRMRLTGALCLQCPNAIVHHIGSSSVGKHSDFKYYYSYRNNVALVVKNTPFWLLPLVLPLFMASQTWWLFRNRHNLGAKARAQGFFEGLKSIRKSLKKRRHIQKKRSVSTVKVCDFLNWSLSDIKTSDFVYKALDKP